MFYQVIGLFTLTLLSIQPAFAGPGGAIAKAAVDTFWGRVITGLIVIFFLPLILSFWLKETLAIRRARKDLAFVAKHDQMANG